MSSIYHNSLIKMIVLHHLNILNISSNTFIANDILHGPQIPPPMPQEVERPSSSAKVKKSEKVKETRVVEKLEAYKTYQRGYRKLFVADRQVFTPLDAEGALPSSSTHRKILAPKMWKGLCLIHQHNRYNRCSGCIKGRKRCWRKASMINRKGNLILWKMMNQNSHISMMALR